MRRTFTLVALTLIASALCLAGTVTGYISDEGCARNEAERNPACAKNCIQSGAVAVLVTDDGKIYKIADQEKIRRFAGEMVAVTGIIEGEQIKTVESAVSCSQTEVCKG